ncbi:hypothetical protein DL93DRAFT_2101143 [Clavulina sp. PMI_390]|nr:hypothetical protein DL93DRAFT_2101143 [Clavulina sp. PMI_390]
MSAVDTASSGPANGFSEPHGGRMANNGASTNGDSLTVEAAGGAKKKKVNPLVDLIETEKSYVDLLAAIIRRVAAAWSRSNFPPPELDAMFRSVEVVYRSNRSLLAKLNEIGPNPSSPKALGDLLMRWIDDLEAPYTRYCNGYTTSFDSWLPEQNNPNLPSILEEISSNIPPSLYATSLDPIWTLDTLFLMPATRLKYYKKLYARLLKSTQPGRSDHKLLLSANDRLSKLLATVEERAAVQVGEDADHGVAPEIPPAAPSPATPSSTFSPPPRKSSAAPGVSPISPAAMSAGTAPPPPFIPPVPGMERNHDAPPPPFAERESSSSSGRDSRRTEERDSRGSVPTSNTSAAGRTSTSTMSAPIIDLERRLSTERVIDLFTMTPRKCRLQMAPPNLTFVRKMRFSADVVIDFTPKSTGQPIEHRSAHIFLLTDLFLVAEHMTDEEKATQDGFDMWLAYPPLSAKHLVAMDAEGPAATALQDNVLEIRIMKKETFIVHVESKAVKEAMLRDFRESWEETMALTPAKPRATEPNPAVGGPPPGASFPPRGSSMPMPPGGSRSPPPPPMPHGMEPPRMQFGRMAAGSEPHLLLPPGPNNGGPGVPPPPPGVSRAPPRANSTDQLSDMNRPSPPRMNSNGPPRMNSAGPPPPPPHLSLPGGGPPDPNALHHLPPLPPSPLPPMNGNGPPFPPQQGGPSFPPSSFDPGPGPGGLRSGAPSMRSFDTGSSHSLQPPVPRTGLGVRPMVPSMMLQMNAERGPRPESPPSSPDEEKKAMFSGPQTSTITADMKCKVFLKQHHAQWKALGAAKLLLYQQQPGNVKQLVVQADNRAKSMIISTIVLTDAVERVGKTGVVIELSDQGQRTGIVYMIQLKSEASAMGLFTTMLAGSDRSVVSP